MKKDNYYEEVLKPLYDERRFLRKQRGFRNFIKLIIVKRKIRKKEKDFCRL